MEQVIPLPNGGRLVYREATEHLVDGTERVCENCVFWGRAESGDWGSCCRLSCLDGVLSTGDGFVRTGPAFGCNEFVGRGSDVLILEGALYWHYDEVFIGGHELAQGIVDKWPDEKSLGAREKHRYRFTIERLE